MNILAKLFLLQLSLGAVLPQVVLAENEPAEEPQATTKSSSKNCDQKVTCPIGPLTDLFAGNQRFVDGKMSHRLQDQKRREELRAGQQPQAIVLACSDSRVPPEVVFDQGLGQIFVVRTAGEVADPVAVASIEYAVEHLHVPLLVVLGHESCGAVKATIETAEGTSAGSENLDKLVSAIRGNLAGTTAAGADKTLTAPVKANVEGVSKTLALRSKLLREKIEAKELLIVKGLYHLDSGKVDIWF